MNLILEQYWFRRVTQAMRTVLSLWGALFAVSFAAAATLASTAEKLPKPPDANGYIFSNNEQKPEKVAAARAAVGEVRVKLPAERLRRLPKTIEKLKSGEPLRIVMLGDSIINDTARSQWHELLKDHYPRANVVRIVSVRGSTGCNHYKAPGKIDAYVVQCRPDLVIIGGISQHADVDSIRECIQQIRDAGCQAELMLMTGPFGSADPYSGTDWRDKIGDGNNTDYAIKLKALADDVNAEYFDLQMAWGDALRASGKPLAFFKRDPVHANTNGEAILALILEQYFKP